MKLNKYQIIKNRLQIKHGNKFNFYLFIKINKPIKEYEWNRELNRNKKDNNYEIRLLNKIHKLDNNKLSIKKKISKKITKHYFYIMKKRLRIKHSIDIYKDLFE